MVHWKCPPISSTTWTVYMVYMYIVYMYIVYLLLIDVVSFQGLEILPVFIIHRTYLLICKGTLKLLGIRHFCTLARWYALLCCHDNVCSSAHVITHALLYCVRACARAVIVEDFWLFFWPDAGLAGETMTEPLLKLLEDFQSEVGKKLLKQSKHHADLGTLVTLTDNALSHSQ